MKIAGILILIIGILGLGYFLIFKKPREITVLSWDNYIGKNTLGEFAKKTKINDLPCGFKAVSRQVRDEVLSQVINTGFFWDTELLILAEKMSFIIKEIPIKWSEFTCLGRKSHVNIIKTSWEYLKQSFLLKKRLRK